ncbi:hypothetical protein AACH06_24865 [Ideonella sp. DXS29W]|uniref:Phage holin family protein n=1 Tax=Ideonella lacteola TaxID=2984193 RepID=A0ABU9BWD9_9BURK
MSRLIMTPFLRNVLRVDAVLSGLTAVMMVADAELMAAWTGLPPGLMTAIGVALLPWAALLAWLSSRTVVANAAIGAVVALNFCWMVDCALAAFGTFNVPQGLGVGLLAVQALGTFVIAELEWMGMKRAPRAASLRGALAS